MGIDPTCFTVAEAEQLEKELGTSFFELCTCPDPYAEIWTDRPPIPQNPVELHPLEYAGESVRSKIGRILAEAVKQQAGGVVISMLDEVAWTLNLRGTDVDYNPVFVSYLVIGGNGTTLYINKEKLTDEVSAYLKENDIDVQPYEQIFDDLKRAEVPLMIQPDKTNLQVRQSLDFPVLSTCPVTGMKS